MLSIVFLSHWVPRRLLVFIDKFENERRGRFGMPIVWDVLVEEMASKLAGNAHHRHVTVTLVLAPSKSHKFNL